LILTYVQKNKFHILYSNPFATTNNAETFLLVLASIGVTFWCQDILTPLSISDAKVTIKAWPDIFYHLTIITGFASSHGYQSIQDAQMVGSVAAMYHVAGYVIPATLADFAGISSLVTYQSLLVPFGLLVLVFSGYLLTSLIFGSWPGLAASICLLLLPDAVAQGFGLGNFGFQWMLQTSPLMSYGIACAALAFIFLFEALRTNKYHYILISYFFTIVTLIFKAHIFVAISYLTLIFPIIFFGNFKRKNRIILLILATIIYFLFGEISQAIESAPSLLLNGEALMSYSDTLLSINNNEYIKYIFSYLFKSSTDEILLRSIYFQIMLFVCTFGIFGVLFLFQVKYLKNNFQITALFFPLGVMVIYLIMASFLTYNKKGYGTSDELLHRPFVWAYFIVVLWSAAVLYHRFCQSSLPKSNILKTVLILISVLTLSYPLYWGKDVQTLKGNWGIGHQVFPVCQLSVSDYVRNNGSYKDIIQLSETDKSFIYAGLSQRNSFINLTARSGPEGRVQRLQEVQDIKLVKSEVIVTNFMKSNTIKWYISLPNDKLLWGSELQKNVVFECGEYKVYQF
jgi:hypothetical protein